MSAMDLGGSLLNNGTSVPAYSPAYQATQPSFAGRRSPGDYVASAYKHSTKAARRAGEAVDIDEAIGEIVDVDEAVTSPNSSFQYSTMTTENLSQAGSQVVRDTEEQFTNLNTGQMLINNRTAVGAAPSSDDHVRAKSVTTRSGMITEDRETGLSSATMETKTRLASVVTSRDGAQEETVTTKQMKTEAASSTSTQRKESMQVVAETDHNTSMEAEGQIVSSQTITSKTRTVETTTYAVEQKGNTETHIEQKVTIQSDGDPIDHDEALAQAIQEATAMNPDFTVEKIEINQTSQE